MKDDGNTMIFIYDGKEYVGATAVEIVRGLEREARGYPHQGGSLRTFLRWSLAGYADRIPLRELDMPAHLPEETLAFSYLCLLDKYDIGRLPDTASLESIESR